MCSFASLVQHQRVRLNTVLVRFLAHASLSEHAPVLEYRHTEVNYNVHVYNIGTPAFSIISQNAIIQCGWMQYPGVYLLPKVVAID